MEFVAVQKFIHMSPTKIRQVVWAVRNLPPYEAVEKLPEISRRAAVPLQKVIKSALSNAVSLGANEKNLIFKEIQVNEGPRLKRWRAASRGRAAPYVKKMSHIRVVLETKEVEEKSKGKVVKERSKRGTKN